MGGIFWLASYPKSGNTWVRTFVANLRSEQDCAISINAIDLGAIASSRIWLDDVLGFDTSDLTPDEVLRLRSRVYDWAARDEEIHYCKIHDAWRDDDRSGPLAGTTGVLGALYIVRNPLDIAASLASHGGTSIDTAIARMGSASNTLSASKVGIDVQVMQPLGTWSQHVTGWTGAPRLNRLVVRYEDLLANPRDGFARIARFLRLPCDPERIERALQFSRFEELRQQEQEAGFRERGQPGQVFFRQGRSGTWREYLDRKQAARVVADHREVMGRFGYLEGMDQQEWTNVEIDA